MLKFRKKFVDAIAQCIRLQLPSCGTGFEAQVHHLCFYSHNLCYICHCIEKEDENNQKETGFGPYF